MRKLLAMYLNYFVVDVFGEIWRVPAEVVEGLWQGRREAYELKYDVGDELRLITVLIDENLMPVVSYFVRLDLDDGRITDESRIEAYEAVTNRGRRRYEDPAAQRQFMGWPSDWQHQLAVALDVPIDELQKIGLGGPLLLSDLWGVPLDKVLEYFEEASRDL